MPYLGKSPSAGVRQRYQYTATAGQTTFSGTDLGNLTLTYTDNNFVDVFQNGVLLKGGGTDYTATSGTSVVLATGASVSDVIEIIVYDVFSVGNFFNRTDSDSRYVNVSGGTMTGSLDLNGTELVLDADGDTSITADTDDQIDIKIGGSDVGVIGSTSSRLHIVNGDTGLRIAGDIDQVFPCGTSGADRDNAIDLGSSGVRFKDLYLGGGIYLGGTGSANKLEDYEEGSWVPVFQNSGSTVYTHQLGKYVKVGSMVVATFHIDINSNNQISTNQLKIDNLPFTVANSSNQYGNIGGLHCSAWNNTNKPDNGLAIPNTTILEFYRSEGVTTFSTPSGNDLGNGNILGHVIFFTD